MYAVQQFFFYLEAFSVPFSITIAEGSLIILILLLTIYLIKNKINILVDCPYFIPFTLAYIVTLFIALGRNPDPTLKDVLGMWVILIVFVAYYFANGNNIRRLIFIFILGALLLSLSVLYDSFILHHVRPRGFVRIPITAGNTLALAISIIISVIITGYEKSKVRLFYIVALLIILAGLFVTETRIALLAIIFSTTLLLIYKYRSKAIVPVLIGTVILVAIIYNTPMYDRFHEIVSKPMDHNTSHGWRIELWKNAIELIKERPFFGTGEFEELVIKMMPYTDVELSTAHAHNTYLHTIVVYGIVGFLFLAYAYYTIVRDLFRRLKDNKYAVMGFFMLITVFVEALVDNTLYDAGVRLTHLFLAATFLGVIRKGFDGDEEKLPLIPKGIFKKR